MDSIDTSTGIALGINELCLLIINEADRETLTNLACINKRWFSLVVPKLWKFTTYPSLDAITRHLNESENMDFYLDSLTAMQIDIWEGDEALICPQSLPRPFPKLESLTILFKKSDGRFLHDLKWVAKKIEASIKRPLKRVVVKESGEEIIKLMRPELFQHSTMVINGALPSNHAQIFSFARWALKNCNPVGLELTVTGPVENSAAYFSDLRLTMEKLARNDSVKHCELNLSNVNCPNFSELEFVHNSTLQNLRVSSLASPFTILEFFRGLRVLHVESSEVFQSEQQVVFKPLENLQEISLTRFEKNRDEFDQLVEYLGLLAPNLTKFCYDGSLEDSDMIDVSCIKSIAQTFPQLKILEVQGKVISQLNNHGLEIFQELATSCRSLESITFDDGAAADREHSTVLIDIDEFVMPNDEILFPNLMVLRPQILFENSGTSHEFSAFLSTHFPRLFQRSCKVCIG